MNATSPWPVYAQALPQRLTGVAALTVPVAGWLPADWVNATPLKIVVDGQEYPMDIGTPLPLMGAPNFPDASKRLAFAGWVTFPAKQSGDSHQVAVTANANELDRYRVPRLDYKAHFTAHNSANVAICMAVYNPDPVRFERQIDSIIHQDHDRWIGIVNDDGSDPVQADMIRRIIAKDPRFYYFKNETNRGFYHNFETAISRVPDSVAYIALSDQDDDWYPHKLTCLLRHLGPTTALVYGDMKLRQANGDCLANSYWEYRLNNFTDFEAQLTANTVTGAACLFKADLKQYLLPFPTRIGDAFHDHWIACCAMAAGGINYVDQALYDYYQYDNSVIGHCGFGQASSAGKADPPVGWVQLWNPLNWKRLLGRLMGSSLAVYWQECRRIEAICRNIDLRMPVDDNARAAFATFHGGMQSVIQLIKAHFRFEDPARLTDNAELRLARGYLFYQLLFWFLKRKGFH